MNLIRETLIDFDQIILRRIVDGVFGRESVKSLLNIYYRAEILLL